MAKIVVVGGGFAGVVAAERLANELSDEHQISLVSRSRNFVFYPALVRLAFGKCKPEDVSFDLRRTMLSRRINFIEAEVARLDLFQRRVMIAHGDVEGKLPYDFLVFALGRRLATERITGFFENAHHLLSVDKALKFGKAVAAFEGGRAVIGQCDGARLPVPVYETAFALAQLLEHNGRASDAKITIVSPDSPGLQLGDRDVEIALTKMLDRHGIELLSDFPITQVKPGTVITNDGRAVNSDLLMLLPPFQGSSAASHLGITNDEGYINVDWTMRVVGAERMYAVGDCVDFVGPKMGHMAVQQGEVAAANLAAEIDGHGPISHYIHEMRAVIDEGGADSLYVHKDLWVNEPASVKQGRFWRWAKQVQQRFWEAAHS